MFKIGLMLLSVVFLLSTQMATDHISPTTCIKRNLVSETGLLINQLQQFKKKVAESRNLDELAQINSTYFIQSRLQYKKLEWIYSYFYPEDVKLINGAPLPRLDPNAVSIIELPPQGFQVLEELIAESQFSTKAEMVNLLEELINNITTVNYLIKNQTITDRHIIESARFNLIRISTLGISGFDSPELLFSLKEGLQSWRAMADGLQLYQKFFLKSNKKETDLLFFHLNKGENYLKKNQDFNSFDRFHFIKEYVNPVYKSLLKLHITSGLETIKEITSYNLKTNYYSENIFSADFLNPQGYSRNPKEKKNQRLIDLGNVLFFDPILSAGNDRSCSSCHQPQMAFSDGEIKSFAIGHEKRVDRNSPSLINSVFATKYFYDGRIDFLDQQIEHVIQDHKEFNTDYTTISQKINNSKEYKRMFNEAFATKNDPVNSAMISMALSQYVKSLVGLNSSFDQQIRGEIKIQENVKKGFNLFMGKAKCGTCHFAPIFNGTVPPFYDDTETEVLGVPDSLSLQKLDADEGRYGVYKFKSPIYKNSFKTTTIRNASLTAPYMHNGVFQTLEQVIDFYNNGGGVGAGLEVPNQTLPSDSLNLTSEEMSDIISFIKALEDTTGLTAIPLALPDMDNPSPINDRKIGGDY